MRNKAFKLIDLFVFSLLLYLAYTQYFQYSSVPAPDPNDAFKFDLVNIAALIFVMFRRADINTVSLTFIILVSRVIDATLLHFTDGFSGFLNYTILIFFNLALVVLIWLRPVILSKAGPWKNKTGFAVTHQDNTLATLLSVQAAFSFLMLVEHATRRIGPWWYENSRILYNNFEWIQFIFTIAEILVLYYMTLDKSKEKQPDRKLPTTNN